MYIADRALLQRQAVYAHSDSCSMSCTAANQSLSSARCAACARWPDFSIGGLQIRHLMIPCSQTSCSPFSVLLVSLRASVRALRLVFSSNILQDTVVKRELTQVLTRDFCINMLQTRKTEQDLAISCTCSSGNFDVVTC